MKVSDALKRAADAFREETGLELAGVFYPDAPLWKALADELSNTRSARAPRPRLPPGLIDPGAGYASLQVDGTSLFISRIR